jgi:glycosyltransferase involved in cell wall biosynthesis
MKHIKAAWTMVKKKIAVCFPQVPFAYGGAEIHVENLCYQLKRHGFEAELIKIPYKWYPKKAVIENAMLWRNIDLTESNGEKIDLVIGTKFPSYGIKHPLKITWLIHQFRQIYDLFNTPFSEYKGNNVEDLRIKEEIKRFDEQTIKESVKVYANSINVAKRLHHYNQLKAEPLYHPPKMIGNYRHETYGDYILSVGRLEKIKRIDLLIKAMKYTSTKIKCFIVGKGPEEGNLKNLTQLYHLEDRVKFLGFVSDKELIQFYANCFAVYYAPFDEDFGYVTQEAFHSKKPVITLSDSGGVLEFVTHQQNGYIEPVDCQALGNRINELYNQRTLMCPLLGEAGYRSVQGISWENVIETLTKTLK